MLGLRTVIYYVPDMEKAKAWYNAVFNATPYFDEPFYAGYNIGGYELGLQPEQGGSAVKSENVLTYWGVEDIEAEFARIVALGATVHEAPTNVGGDIVVATVKDLWGNIIGLIYNPTFGKEA